MARIVLYVGAWNDGGNASLVLRHDRALREDEDMADGRTATLYRMVLPDHVCPFGTRAKALLEEHGYRVEDRVLASRGQVVAFEREQGVVTTPQVFIDGERIGGSDELERWLAASADDGTVPT